jgi:hypothetical protein
VTKDKLDKNQIAKMFCSEFISYCYHRAADVTKRDRFVQIAQDMLSPEELYVHFRDNIANFDYVGELHAHVR